MNTQQKQEYMEQHGVDPKRIAQCDDIDDLYESFTAHQRFVQALRRHGPEIFQKSEEI